MKITNIIPLAVLSTLCFTPVATAENVQHIRQLLSTKQCPGCDLSGAGLVMANLPNANLSQARLTRANLSRAILTYADFSGADLRGTSFFGADLSGANFKGADLRGADLRGAYLVNADLTDAQLEGANLQGSIGTPASVLKVEDVYNWGVAAAQQNNLPKAIEFFNQALALNREFAPAYLARSVVQLQMGRTRPARADAEIASQLFAAQNNVPAFETSQQLLAQIELVENPPKQGGSNILQAITSLGLAILQFMF